MDLGWMRPLGAAIRGLRAGTHQLATHAGWLSAAPESIRVTSPAFGAGTDIPARFTTDGPGLSPPLAWSNVPAGAASVAVLVEDPDIPIPVPLVHLLAYAIPATETTLAEGAIPRRLTGPVPSGLRAGRNGFGRTGWLPITPPPGHGPHHYAFQVFALDTTPRFDHPPGRHTFMRAIRGHVVGWGVLFGVYERV